MDVADLRDHADAMLSAVAADLETAQSPAAQKAKSQGNAPIRLSGPFTAAQAHGSGRAESGFLLGQMVAEFRALRATVIRLWSKARQPLTPESLDDLTRFNEAIDQLLAESVTRYTADLENSKEMFLGILSHDLRTPLSAIMTSTQFLLDMNGQQEPQRTLMARAVSSANRMQEMIDKLLDFTRSRLGGGIPIQRADMSMEKAVYDVVDEVSAAHPDRVIRIDGRDGMLGKWDFPRISQAVSNLIGNALQHGSAEGEITVKVAGGGDEVTVAVHNSGPSIPPEQINGIFRPMKRNSATPVGGTPALSANLGLGLYIAERIVSAHGGRIDVESTDDRGTTFTVHLPRDSQPETEGL